MIKPLAHGKSVGYCCICYNAFQQPFQQLKGEGRSELAHSCPILVDALEARIKVLGKAVSEACHMCMCSIDDMIKSIEANSAKTDR